jgi:Spy/CpxP family protein refolding chaperone
MKNKAFICTLAAAIVTCGLTSTRTYAGDSTPPMAGRIFQRIAQRLNLTDDQKSQIKTIVAGERDTLRPLLAALRDTRNDLRAAIRSGDANESSVRAASAKVAVVEADLAVERMKLYGKIAPVLTSAQRQKIADFEQDADGFADNVVAQIGSGLDN